MSGLFQPFPSLSNGHLDRVGLPLITRVTKTPQGPPHTWCLLLSVGTCSPGQVDPTGKWKECKQSLMWDGKWSINLASQENCTGVFIGTRASNVPRQGRLCPRVPGLSLEYSHKGRLQTVVIEKLLQMRPVTCLSTRGPLQWADFHVGLWTR
jgi:hypothetical protein